MSELEELMDDLRFAIKLDGVKSLLPEECQILLDLLDVPKNETVYSWEKRTGKIYSESGPVYVKYMFSENGKRVKPYWELSELGEVEEYSAIDVIIANSSGKPEIPENTCDYGVNSPTTFQSEDSSKRFFKPN